MFLMYVDESGDPGLVGSPTQYFVLSGLVVHELRWNDCLQGLISFRQQMKQSYGLKLREEFHAAELIGHPGDLARIPKYRRMEMIRHYAAHVATMPEVNLINIVVDKATKQPGYNVFEMGWTALIQRFENTIQHRRFPGPANADDKGLIFCDHTDDKKLMSLIRRRRHFNPVPNQPTFGGGYRNMPIQYIVEDPSFRDSRHSYFVQTADLVAYLLYQNMSPNAYLRRVGGRTYFQRLMPVLCLVASRNDPHGIVRL